MARKYNLCQHSCDYEFYTQQSVYGMVGETPLIRGCRSLILNELVIKMTGKKSYEIEYH